MTNRPTAHERGYTARWQRARAAFLEIHKHCVLCAQFGNKRRATVVDHIKPHRGDHKLFWDQSNWQPLCQRCHNSVKQSADRTGRMKGCGVDGLPLDPNHEWNKGGGGVPISTPSQS